MKNKVVIAVLSLICIASVSYNIYQYNILNANRQQLSDAQTQLDNMANSYADLDAQLAAMQGKLESLNADMANKQSEIESLAKENSDLMSSISELEESIKEAKRIAKEKAIAESKGVSIEEAVAEQTAPTQNYDPDLQAEMLIKAEEYGFAIGGFDVPIEHATDIYSPSNAVWE